jgi:hypothetical protein
MEILEKIAKVKELLPKLKDPARIAKAQEFLAAHGEEQRTGLIGSGTGNQQEGLAGLEDKLPEKVTATMPESPSALDAVASTLGAGAVGLDNGLFAGIPHRVAAADISSPLDTAHGKAVGDAIESKVAHGLANKEGESTADTEARISGENPLVTGAGEVSSLLMGGLPALIDRGLARVMEKAGLKAAPSAIGKQALLGAARGAGVGVASGAAQDAGEAADNALRGKPVDMSLEGDKMAIRALLGGALGGVGGALGSRAAANLDPSTSAGAGGTAQQLLRIRRLGGDVGLAGVEVPPSVKPLYEEAMAGGTDITPRIGGLRHPGHGDFETAENAVGGMVQQSPEDAAALQEYLNVERMRANESNRYGIPNKLTDQVNGILSNAQAQGNAYAGPVYRGMSKAELDSVLGSGSNKSIWSVGSTMDRALAHARGPDSVIVEIPGHSGAVPVGGVPGSNTFEEALVPKGTGWRLAGQRDVGGRTVYTLENVDSPASYSGKFSPGSHVEDVAAEKALGPVQRGIAAADRGNAQKFQEIDQAFYNSSAKHQRFEPKEVTKTLQRFIKARTFKDGSPVPYANSGEPIKELNKLYDVGSPISAMDKKADQLAHPGSFAIRLEDARSIGFNVPAQPRNPMSHVPGPEQEAFVVITPKMVSPEQFEQAMQGINNAAKAAEVRGSPDALHAELQQAGFKDRREIKWPAEIPWPKGVSRQVHLTLPGDKGSTTLNDWAAIQAQKAEKLGNMERDLFFMGTTPAEATNETTGARAILNALKTVGNPGSSRAERSLSKFAVDQPGGREALNDMESVNMIEGASGLRNKLGASGANPLSAHNRHAIGLRLDPAMRAAGTIFPRAGAAAPDDRAVIKALLQSYGIGAR